jgi:hypothetical protein
LIHSRQEFIPLKAEIVPAGSLVIDTDQVLTAASIAAIHAARPDVRGAIRYVSLAHPGVAGDITAEEVAAIVGAGWGLMLVQHCRFRFFPSRTLGEADGTAAANNAAAVGYPTSAIVAVDWEGYTKAGDDGISYLNEVCGIIRALGYEDMVYAGFGQPGVTPLTSEQLYYDLTTERYWQPASADAPVVAVRGPCIRQQLPSVIAGVAVDLNVVRVDNKMGLPAWAVAA